MNLSPQQLSSVDSIQPIYHLFGAETLLIEESLQQLRNSLKEHDYLEREKLYVEAGFDWNDLLASSQTLSLFSQKRIIELRMPSAKPGDKGAKALIEYTQICPDDTVLILISGEIDKRAQNSKWFKALNAVGASIAMPKIWPNQLASWIQNRLQHSGIKAEHDVAPLIAQYVEGNLHAAAQQVAFLGLHTEDAPLNVEKVQSLLSDQARFNSFAFVDACLAGQAGRSVRILLSLKNEKIPPILILSALSRETTKILELSCARHQGQNTQPLYKRLGIWASRQNLISSALTRISHLGWLKIHAKMSQLDSMSKGQIALNNKDIWLELERIGLAISGHAPMLR